MELEGKQREEGLGDIIIIIIIKFYLEGQKFISLTPKNDRKKQ